MLPRTPRQYLGMYELEELASFVRINDITGGILSDAGGGGDNNCTGCSDSSTDCGVGIIGMMISNKYCMA